MSEPGCDRTDRIRDLFDEVVGLEPETRTARLDEACLGDAELRREVESLLQTFPRTDDILLAYEEGLIFSQTAPGRAHLEADPYELVGRTISQYRFDECLGTGGMGVVYRAHDTTLDRTVALKLLPPELTRDAEARGRLLNEARAAAALDHVNICTIYEIGEIPPLVRNQAPLLSADQAFIAMAYYEGEALKEKISRGPLSIDAALGIASQIASGLEAAHLAGIVHRDMKPANIMVTDRGEVKLVDFGLAKLAGSVGLTRPGTIMGTVAYMSPEQAGRQKVDHRTDLWSLGVILFEMLTAQQPFPGGRAETVLLGIRHDEAPSVRVARPEVPQPIADVVEKLLRKDPARRYQAASEVRNDLRAIHPERAPGPVSPPPLLPRRISKLAWTGAVVFAIILSALGYLHFKPQSETVLPAKRPTVAVLPLRMYSPGPGQSGFADAMTEALIGNLSRIEGLVVRSRQSVMRYARSEEPLPHIAEALQVDYLLEGSVFWGADSLNIDAQLIRGPTDTHVWSGHYEEDTRKVRKIQQDVTLAIAREIGAALTPENRRQLQEAPEIDPEAYRLYIRGQLVRTAGQEGTRERLRYFEQAVERDPSFAPAWAALGYTHAWLARSGTYIASPIDGLRISDEIEKAREYLAMATQMDPALDLPYLTNATLLQLEGEWDAAEKSLRKAIELAPGRAESHYELCRLLVRTGDLEEALEAAKQAVRNDPVSGYSHQVMTETHYFRREYDEAIEWGQTWIESRPFPAAPALAHYYLAAAYWRKGQSDKALASAEDAVALDSIFVGVLGFMYGRTGRRQEALDILEISRKRGQAWAMVETHLGLGQKEQALDWFETSLFVRSGPHEYVRFYTLEGAFWNSLRSEPRLQTLLTRLGLEP